MSTPLLSVTHMVEVTLTGCKMQYPPASELGSSWSPFTPPFDLGECLRRRVQEGDGGPLRSGGWDERFSPELAT